MQGKMLPGLATYRKPLDRHVIVSRCAPCDRVGSRTGEMARSHQVHHKPSRFGEPHDAEMHVRQAVSLHLQDIWVISSPLPLPSSPQGQKMGPQATLASLASAFTQQAVEQLTRDDLILSGPSSSRLVLVLNPSSPQTRGTPSCSIVGLLSHFKR